MKTVVVGNSTSVIKGYSVTEEKELRKLLCYTPPASVGFFTGGYAKPRYLISKTGEFPTGLLSMVLKWCDGNFEIVDNRTKPKIQLGMHVLKLPYKPYAEQIQAVDACVKVSRGIVSAVTGFGKSLLMALLIHRMQLKTLVIVPNLELKRQLTESFKEYFGDLTNITIENIDSNSLPKHTNYDMLLIDEAHHVAAKTYRDLNKKAWKGIYYRYFFTATPFRSRDEEQILFESIAGDIIYTVSYHDAAEKGHIVRIEPYYITVPRTVPKGNIKMWASMYSELVVHNDARNEIISDLAKNLKAAGKSTLILVKEIAHGEILSSLTNLQFANGKNTDSVDIIKFFNQQKLPAIIGTTGVIGEGIDTKPCEYVIIAGLGKSRPAFMQQIGRGIRKFSEKDSCKIIIFKDPSHKWTLAHFREQCKTLREEYGVEPIEIKPSS